MSVVYLRLDLIIGMACEYNTCKDKNFCQMSFSPCLSSLKSDSNTIDINNDVGSSICGQSESNRKYHVCIDFLAVDGAGSEIWEQSHNTQRLTIER